MQETWFCNSSTTPLTRLSHTDYDGSGRVYQSIDADGNTTTSIYDSAGRRTGVVDANGNSSTYGYDENGNQTAFIDANGHEIDYGYDALNRRVQTVYPVSSVYVNGSYTNTATDAWTAYDELGRKIAEYEQSPVSQPLASRNIKRYVYDVDGRLTDVVDALGQDTHYAYDELGNETLQRDANQHSTTYTYDNLGRRISRTLPAGQVESTHYDDNGNLQSRTDFNGRTTTFQYDALNRLRFRIPDPSFNEQTVEWRYTASGQRDRMIDSTGTTIYSYDDRDRLTSKATPEGTLGYGYDDQNNLKSITSSTPGGAAVSYTYDALNRLSTVNDVNNQQTIYNYDAVGNLGSVALPNGVTSVYHYDALNRLSTLTHTSAASIGAIASYAYGVFPTGQRQMAAEGTGRTSVYSYDTLWRLQGETITGDQHARNGALGYGYDPVGNRKARTSTVTGLAVQSFTYDPDDRVNGDTYDSNGNTVVGSASQPASAYAAATGVAAPPPAIPSGATSSGSAPDTSKPVLGTDTYDSFDRLVKRTGATGSVQITYNGDGEKVAETITQAGLTVTTTYLLDELNPTGYSQVLEESTNGSLSRVYTFGLELISQDEVLSATGSQISWTATYYGYDGHGNVRFLTNGAGAVTDTYDFDAFGNLLNVTSGFSLSGSTSATPNLHLYCGEPYDSAIGQYYLRARVMNPLTGRFWTMDTEQWSPFDPKGLHKYTYSSADPVNRFDPSGRDDTTLPSQTAAVGVDGVLGRAALVNVLRAYAQAYVVATGILTSNIGIAVSESVLAAGVIYADTGNISDAGIALLYGAVLGGGWQFSQTKISPGSVSEEGEEFVADAVELSKDGSQGNKKISEGIGLARYKRITGATVTRPTGAEQGVDAVAGTNPSNTKAISLKGPLINQNGPVRYPGAFEGFKNSVTYDLKNNGGAKELVVDLMGCSEQEVSEILKAILATQNRYNKQIRIIR